MPFKTAISDLYQTVIQETTTSFIFGTTAAIAKELFNNDKNFISKNVLALRKGVEHAEHAMLYNAMLFVTRLMRLKRSISHLICIMICSFVSGQKNGNLFALKSAVFSLISNMLSSLIMFE
ncbi:uncharacterized protein VICG_01387 [Vittaforma corneae ATCC 50505]|uniref:Uncharacterized protein n=1 Tax=Vittaforma corneae (strain ATCC 50505) TaxID=993615 RepID=L2GKW0_VITCO|nr:uncharacterized protein VICG_01387 [Vittaforma corneae ATCC 50505]ELA41523.1 hypothetical protein VICG_01387 [Vittaforma corneae ATCC 50505]